MLYYTIQYCTIQYDTNFRCSFLFSLILSYSVLYIRANLVSWIQVPQEELLLNGYALREWQGRGLLLPCCDEKISEKRRWRWARKRYSRWWGGEVGLVGSSEGVMRERVAATVLVTTRNARLLIYSRSTFNLDPPLHTAITWPYWKLITVRYR